MALSRDTRRVLDVCKRRSDRCIENMRESALERFGDSTEFLIGVNGSYARREATEESDVDLFFLTTGSEPSSADESQAEFRGLLEEDLNLNPPASGGVFENPLPVEKISEIGGQTDDFAIGGPSASILSTRSVLTTRHGTSV